jgi:hypothetical protein
VEVERGTAKGRPAAILPPELILAISEDTTWSEYQEQLVKKDVKVDKPLDTSPAYCAAGNAAPQLTDERPWWKLWGSP